jgi:hypothetical protein
MMLFFFLQREQLDAVPFAVILEQRCVKSVKRWRRRLQRRQREDLGGDQE